VGEDVTEKDYSDFFEGFRSINEDDDSDTLWLNRTKKTLDKISQPKKIPEYVRTAVSDAKNDMLLRNPNEPNTGWGTLEKGSQGGINSNAIYRNELYPEKYTDITQGVKKKPYNGKSRYDELYGEHTKEGLDVLSKALAVASVVPGLDTFMDLAAVPVDLLRGDYVSAGLDLVGAIPFAGETADTARLAKLGFEAADVMKDADNAVDMARAVDKADDASKISKFAESTYSSIKNKTIDDAYPLASKYVNSSEPLYRNADNIKPVDGYEDIVVHGDSRGFSYRDKNGVDTTCTAREMAEMIKSNPNYKGGPIRLISCETGAEEFGAAQMLANQLGVEVMAPSHTAWVMPDGEIRIGRKYDTNEGIWKIFKPRGVTRK